MADAGTPVRFVAGHPGSSGPISERVTVIVSRGTEDVSGQPRRWRSRVGDRLRIGATHWEKQLFNGTVVTVEDLEVRREKRRAPKQRAIEEEKAGARNPEPEQSFVSWSRRAPRMGGA